MYIDKTEHKNHTTYDFGSRKIWLNHDDVYCGAFLIWYVLIQVNRKDGEGVLEAEFKVNREGSSHSVYWRGDLHPIQRLNRESHQFELAVKTALEWCETEGIKLERYF